MVETGVRMFPPHRIQLSRKLIPADPLQPTRIKTSLMYEWNSENHSGAQWNSSIRLLCLTDKNKTAAVTDDRRYKNSS